MILLEILYRIIEDANIPLLVELVYFVKCSYQWLQVSQTIELCSKSKQEKQGFVHQLNPATRKDPMGNRSKLVL